MTPTTFSVRLSEILRHQAALLEHIVAEQRYYPDYYRVTFHGNFPVAIRDKRFIVRYFLFFKTPLTLLYSTAAMSGKDLGLFVKECSTSTQELSCLDHQETRRLTYATATTSIYNAPP